MVVRQEPGLGRVSTRPAGFVAPSGDAPVWDDAVRVRTPDLGLDHAIEVARAAVDGRRVLQPDVVADGAARLAQRLAAADLEDPRLDRLLGVLRSRARDGLVRGRDGEPLPVATAVLGRCEAAQHDPRAWDRVAALAAPLRDVEVGEGEPQHAAALLALVGTLLVQVRGLDVEVLPILPDDWFGEAVEVRGIPVAGGGRASWALDWVDDWPVLKWATSVPGRRVTAPGLAPGWSDARARGRADLTPGAGA